jgi:hypothetical protein
MTESHRSTFEIVLSEAPARTFRALNRSPPAVALNHKSGPDWRWGDRRGDSDDKAYRASRRRIEAFIEAFPSLSGIDRAISECCEGVLTLS